MALRKIFFTENCWIPGYLGLTFPPDRCMAGQKDGTEESVVLRADGRSRAEKLERLKAEKTIRIKIQSPSDRETDPGLLPLWGDYWVKQELGRAFQELGLIVVDESPDVLLHLFGRPPKRLEPKVYNLVWVYSHPDEVTVETLQGFDRLFCPSTFFTRRLIELGYPDVETMIGATAKTPQQVPVKYDVIFVGNARTCRADGRSIVRDMGYPSVNFKVWGNLWDSILPRVYYGGRYWPYDRLEYLYASSRICLNDHQPDMARAGFVAVRIFDILASGSFVISDQNPGLTEIFGRTVPQYRDAGHLRELVDFFLRHPEDRERLRLEGQRIALRHTYLDRATQLLRDFWPAPGRGGADAS